MKRVLVWLAIMTTALFLFINYRIYKIEGSSMNYGLIEGDMVLCKRNVSNIERGDMLVVEQQGDEESRLYIKRCVALPGDRIFEKKRFFYLQIESASHKTYELAIAHDLQLAKTKEGYFIQDPYLKYYGISHNFNLLVPPALSHYPMSIVMKDHYFLLGDYRDNSADSRFFGAVPKSWIRSKVIYIFKKPRNWMELISIKEAD